MEKRDLDGCYFRIERDGKWQSVCFSDLTNEEMDWVLEGQEVGWMKSLCKHLAHVIRSIGEVYDLRGE